MSEVEMVTFEVEGWHCHRCDHDWVPRKETVPRICPRCKSPWWDVPKSR